MRLVDLSAEVVVAGTRNGCLPDRRYNEFQIILDMGYLIDGQDVIEIAGLSEN